MTLVATPGSPIANAYCTVAEADAYHLTRMFSTWDNVSDKEGAIIQATRMLDLLYQWEAFPTTTTQALQWPRSGVLDTNGLTFVGDMVIPEEIKNACAEFAMQLAAADRTADSDLETQGITGLTAGPVSLQFSGKASFRVVPSVVGSMIPRIFGKQRNQRGMIAQVERA